MVQVQEVDQIIIQIKYMSKKKTKVKKSKSENRRINLMFEALRKADAEMEDTGKGHAIVKVRD